MLWQTIAEWFVNYPLWSRWLRCRNARSGVAAGARQHVGAHSWDVQLVRDKNESSSPQKWQLQPKRATHEWHDTLSILVSHCMVIHAEDMTKDIKLKSLMSPIDELGSGVQAVGRWVTEGLVFCERWTTAGWHGFCILTVTELTAANIATVALMTSCMPVSRFQRKIN
jgi:hypothetical protein